MSKKYSNRLRDLKEMRKALNFFEEKIKFTYEPIPDVFEEISHKVQKNIDFIKNMHSVAFFLNKAL